MGEIALGYGLHLDVVASQTAAVERSRELLRRRDATHPCMYLPPLPRALEEDSVACLFRPTRPLAERDEDDVRAEGWPPSRYDDPADPLV